MANGAGAAPAGAAGGDPRQRHVVTFAEGAGPSVEAALARLGVPVLLRGPNFFAVELQRQLPARARAASPVQALFGGAKEAASVGSQAAAVVAIEGVTSVQRDRVVAAPRGADAAGGAADADEWREALADAPPGDCSTQDVVLGRGPFPEIQPYFVKQVQADSPRLGADVPSTVDRGVLICVIDSGVDGTHPEFANNSTTHLDGCKEQDSDAPAGCPFQWDRDITGHGTHVSGIIGAPRNGFGVVGTIPGGAEIYLVRIFNDSGDVNQGQGYVYGSTLILAYTQCEGKLAFLQASQPDKKWRMVVSMSLGAPGPLTIEKMFFKEATQRPDMLFVASSGNNGTDSYQWLNFPAAYDGVVSVAAVDCRNQVMPWSQRNARVDIAAPGSDILSSYPVWKAAKSGATSAYLAYGDVYFNVAPGAFYGGSGTFKGAFADCGYGSAPCPAAKGAGCLVQALARNETAPDGSAAQVIPTTCEMAAYCLDQGAAAVVLVPPAVVPGFGSYPKKFVSAPMLDCTLGGKVKCACWDRVKSLWQSGKMPPVAAVTIDQADKLRGLISAPKPPEHLYIRTASAPYRRMSGTSMATPVVAAIAARVWARFPDCTSDDVREALFRTAKDIGDKGFDKKSGHGLVQAEAAYDWLAAQGCANPAVLPVPVPELKSSRPRPRTTGATWKRRPSDAVPVPETPHAKRARTAAATWVKPKAAAGAPGAPGEAPHAAAAKKAHPAAAATKKAPAAGKAPAQAKQAPAQAKPAPAKQAPAAASKQAPAAAAKQPAAADKAKQ